MTATTERPEPARTRAGGALPDSTRGDTGPGGQPQGRVMLPAIAGAVSAATALGLSELVAGVLPGVPSLLYAIGGAVIDLGAGTPVKDIAIALFGTNEKTALVIGTVILSVIFGAGLGVLAIRRSIGWAVSGFVLFGLLGIAATTASPLDDTTLALVPAVLSVAAGLAVLRYLLQFAADISRAASSANSTTVGLAGRGRREFLRIAVGLTAAAGVIGALGRSLMARAQTSVAREEVVLPDVVRAAPPVADAASFDGIDGISPLFTPNDEFYRIDTALATPMVDVETWSLRIHGMVDGEVELTYDDLIGLEQVEADVTIACVSNEVGGDLIGTARWQGVRLADVLDMAGVDPQATQIVGRSVDGWTAGFPTEIAFDGRDALIAVAMNGEPLPTAHGFPARLIVPGLYGYVSATKWLSDIELTTWEAFDGYWIPRGWSKLGPIKTQSRIDVPRRNQQLPAGEAVIAGVAWAQHRGLERIEVSIDDGEWQQAEMAEEVNIDTWRQWRFTWDAEPGDHSIKVRATDRTGETQRGTPVPVAPNGAEGYHTRVVRVV